jgi:hypothetical protein
VTLARAGTKHAPSECGQNLDVLELVARKLGDGVQRRFGAFLYQQTGCPQPALVGELQRLDQALSSARAGQSGKSSAAGRHGERFEVRDSSEQIVEVHVLRSRPHDEPGESFKRYLLRVRPMRQSDQLDEVSDRYGTETRELLGSPRAHTVGRIAQRLSQRFGEAFGGLVG